MLVREDVKTYTAGDGYVLWYRTHYPEAPPRSHVICLHGIQSHGGWYQYSCRSLADAGHGVAYLDRRGSGLNRAERGDAPSFRRLIDDVADFLHQLRENDPITPRFVAACSWGGKLAVGLCRRHPGIVQGLALLCPGLFPKVQPTIGERLDIAKSRLFRPRKRFPIPLNDPQLFTASAQWQEFIAKDPLSLRSATARLLFESARLDLYLRAAPKHVTVPTLLLLAARDRIIDNERTRAFVERFATNAKRIITYPEAHHTLEFEPEPDQFINDLLGWLASTSKRAESGEALAPPSRLP